MLENRQSFKTLTNWLEDAKTKNYNLAIISLPGTGLSHYLKVYAQQNPKSTSYITDIGTANLRSQNIIDVSLQSNPQAASSIDQLVLSSGIDQKFVVIVDDPYWFHHQPIVASSFLSRIYRTEYFPVHNEKDTTTMALEINPDLSVNQQKFIVENSCGLAKIIKYLAINSQVDASLTAMLQPLVSVLTKCTDDDFEKLGIKHDGLWQSKLVSSLLEKQCLIQGFQIIINSDLTVTEDGYKYVKPLSLSEKNILQAALENNGSITKEKISELKWGGDSYDNYSDQAIRKTMVRLSSKLTRYRLRSISKSQYQLEHR